MEKKCQAKKTLALIVLSLFFALGAAYYRSEFIRWDNMILTYGCFAIMAICPGLVTLLGARCEQSKKKKAVSFVTATACFALVSFAITLIINNLIGNGLLARLSVDIATTVSAVMYLILLIVLFRKKPVLIVLGALSVAIVAGILIGTDAMETKKMNSRVAEPTVISEAQWAQAETIGKDADFYISVDGSDENDGSFEHPFASFEKAKEAVKALDKTDRKEIKVGVFPGDYRTTGLVFNEEDSGTKDCPIIYGVCGEGECTVNAGVSIKPEDFEHVTDEKVLSRLSDGAKENVLCLDLGKYGITAGDYGKIYAIGSYNTASHYTGDYVGPLYCELFVNDSRMTLARYPDEGWLETEKVISTGYGRETDGATTARADFDTVVDPESDVYGISAELTDRIASWATLEDVWMFGFWKYDWADASSPIGSFDAENKTLSPKFVSTYGTKTGAPYYFFNVFEELTVPGEWYLDRENGILYVYPDEDFENSSVDLSLGTDNILTGNNVSYMTFDGFTFKGTRGDAINISGNGNTVQNCLIKNVAGSAVYMNGYDNLVTRCEITHTGKAGITLNGGDRETLKAGNNKADNNLIHDWSEIYQTYQPAVTLNGVGNICSHNEIYNSPHEAITYGGNNHLIEYNNIHDVCLLSDDAGAIYAGRRWDYYGTVIRYNSIVNPGSGEHKPNGIYFDDALSGQTAYGNLLVNVPQNGFHLGGGRDLTVTNNIIINSNKNPISYDQRAIDGVFGGWFNHSSKKDGDMWTNLEASPYKSEIWQKAFPQMTKFSDDFDDTDSPDFVPNPAYSDVSGNLIINVRGKLGDISEKADKYSTIANNALFTESDYNKIFVDAKNGDYNLKENSAVYDILPDFEALPLSEIGRYE